MRSDPATAVGVLAAFSSNRKTLSNDIFKKDLAR
jgi:hypothetical protein